MHEDVARAFAFMRRGDMAGSREEPSTLGVAVFEDRLPGRWDSNYLLVERETTLAQLESELRRLERRLAVVPDAELGERLAAEAPAGWRVDRHVVMVHRRPAEREADIEPVREVDERELRPLRQRLIESEPWGDAATARVLLDAKPLIAERVTARFFAADAAGDVASYADLYLDPPEAQIEDVATDPAHRGRGLATAVVLRALREAHAAGAGFVFLVADAADWPRTWYARLGFDEVGQYVKLLRPR